MRRASSSPCDSSKSKAPQKSTTPRRLAGGRSTAMPTRCGIVRVGHEARDLCGDLRPRRVAGEHDPPGVDAQPVGVVDEVGEGGGDLAHRRGVALAGGDRVVHAHDGEAAPGEHAQVVGDVALGARHEGPAVHPHDGGQCLLTVGAEDVEAPVRVGDGIRLVDDLDEVGRCVRQQCGACAGGAPVEDRADREGRRPRREAQGGACATTTTAPAATTAPTAAAPIVPTRSTAPVTRSRRRSLMAPNVLAPMHPLRRSALDAGRPEWTG